MPTAGRFNLAGACQGAFFTSCRGAGARDKLAETCQLGHSTPRFLAAQRSAVSSRREEIAVVALAAQHNTRVCGPLCDPMGSRHEVSNHWGKLLRFLPALSFWIAAAIWYAMHSAIRLPGSELTVFRRRKAFLLCKNPCGGTAVGRAPAAVWQALPARKIFQRKIISRRVGCYKFVVLPTCERSKVRRHARPVKS